MVYLQNKDKIDTMIKGIITIRKNEEFDFVCAIVRCVREYGKDCISSSLIRVRQENVLLYEVSAERELIYFSLGMYMKMNRVNTKNQ